MATENQVAELSTSVKKTLEFEKKDLVKRPGWGTITFQNAEQDLTRIFELLNYLNILPLEYLTDQAVNQIKQKVDNILPILGEIDNFSIEQGTPPQNRDALVNRIHGVADQLYTDTAPWIPFLAYQKGDVAKNIATLSSSVEKANTLVDKTKNEIQ
jgi:hypothetical protein